MKIIFCIFYLQRYLDDAEKDKERYLRDMEAYQKTDAYKLFKLQKEKKLKSKFDIFIVLKNLNRILYMSVALKVVLLICFHGNFHIYNTKFVEQGVSYKTLFLCIACSALSYIFFSCFSFCSLTSSVELPWMWLNSLLLPLLFALSIY